MKLEEGEIIELDDSIEYIVLKIYVLDDIDYVILATTKKPIEISIKKQILKENNICLEDVTEEELKKYFLI